MRVTINSSLEVTHVSSSTGEQIHPGWQSTQWDGFYLEPQWILEMWIWGHEISSYGFQAGVCNQD